jgi:hypothetical protein
MSVMNEVRILDASFEDDTETGQTVVRGHVDQDTLKYIKFGPYQRERGFSQKHTNELVSAYFANEQMADITLGMRGARTRDIKSKGNGIVGMALLDPVYCINGGQRVFSAAAAKAERPDVHIHLGAKVLFNTTEESENRLFGKLGTTEVRIAPSVLLRNLRKQSAAVNMLVGALTKDAAFALKDRIAWDQSYGRGELIAGFTLGRVVGALHSHKGGALKSTKVHDLAAALDALVDKTGPDAVRANAIRFFDALDKVWSIRKLSGRRDPRPQLNLKFMLTIATLCSNYSEFWDGTERNDFYFLDKYVKRLKGFKLEEFVRGTSNRPQEILYEILRKRLNLNPIFGPEAEAAE